jgi:hypothetical protein
MLTSILLETLSYSNSIMYKAHLNPEHYQKPKQRLARMALWEVIKILFSRLQNIVRISYIKFVNSTLLNTYLSIASKQTENEWISEEKNEHCDSEISLKSSRPRQLEIVHIRYSLFARCKITDIWKFKVRIVFKA